MKDLIQATIIITAFLFVGFSLIYNTTKSCDVYIDYDATVDPMTTENATGPHPAEIKLACYQMCIDQLKARDTMYRQCMDKCETII